MFGKPKEKKSADEPKSELHLNVMPGEFYGGRNPVIAYKQETFQAPAGAAPPVPPPSSASPAPLAVFKYKKILIIGGSMAFVAAMGVITWYYLTAARRGGLAPVPSRTGQTQTQATPPAEASGIAPVTPEIVSSTAVTPTPAAGQISAPSIAGGPLELPRKIFTDSADLDGDALTDMEEELFGTDSGVYDSDADGYYDGQEIANLYNPKGAAPVKLIDSGLVTDYVNPTWQYRVYYPNGWAAAAVDPASNQALFSAITGDYIDVRAFQKQDNEAFTEWFGRMAENQAYTDLASFKNRFAVAGFSRDDHLVAYFDTANAVYVVAYHPGGSSAIPFRHIMEMMTQSFRPNQSGGG